MKTGRKVFIIVAILIVIVGGGIGYYAYQIMNSSVTVEPTNLIETMPINNEKSEIVLSGQVKTKETKSENYDYETYGKYWSSKVSVGQHVKKGDIIVEAGKKDYKAPFDGYVTELNAQTAYDEAKKAYDDDTFVTNPTILYTIISDEYYIESSLTEYEINRLPENKVIKYAIRAADINAYHDASIRVLSGTPKEEQPGAAGTTKKSDISSYQLLLNMDTGKELARVGNHVTIRISNTNQPALLIPVTAVLKEEGKTYAFIVNQGNGPTTVTKTEIKGTEENDKFRVDSGLANGDIIATSHVEELMDGGIVQTANENSENNQMMPSA